MAHVLQITNGGIAEVDLGSTQSDLWIEFDLAFDSTALAAMVALTTGSFAGFTGAQANGYIKNVSGVLEWVAETGGSPLTPATPLAALQFYHVQQHLQSGSPGTFSMWIDGTAVPPNSFAFSGTEFFDLLQGTISTGNFYFDNFKIGTTDGGSDLGSDNFEGGTLAFWNSTVTDATIITDPGIAPSAGTEAVNGRVSIAFDDGPLVANPSWTVLDQGGAFPENFVAGYDLEVGRQTLLSQTDTGTATVYINDRAGLFDDRNDLSPYQGKLSGRQILLQLYDPVRGVWEEEFRGLIDNWTYDIDGSAVDANGDPINASIQIECVDIFDYFAGYGLTPGLDGVTPPAGSMGTVYYAETSGTVQDRILEVLTDATSSTWVAARSIVASGNVRVQAAKYDADESALTVLRDCADAELPFIANIYVNRHGQFVFRGRYSRFYPDDVAAEPGSEWDFQRWAVGDGPAIVADPTRAQMRELSYDRSRGDLINAAMCYPQGIADADMPGQVFANTPSITAYGKHTPPGPMSDLLTLEGNEGSLGGTNFTANQETAAFAELLVKNKKDPRVTLTALKLESINPTDSRAATTWKMLTQADISDIVNVAVGYPGGTGFTGGSPQDDYYVEGRRMTVRPANTGYDMVELDLEVSAAIWSMDTNGVFPNPFA